MNAVAFIQLEQREGVFIAKCGDFAQGSPVSPLLAARVVAAQHFETSVGEIVLTVMPDNKVFGTTKQEFLKGPAS